MRCVIPVIALALAASMACATDPSPPPPSVQAVSVAANPTNVLAATVSVTADHADSVRVLFHAAGQSGDSVTPGVAGAGTLQLDVLGLLPERSYVFRAAAF